jgi:hypothetical protein
MLSADRPKRAGGCGQDAVECRDNLCSLTDAAKIVAIPWQIAAGGDFSYPEATGPRPPLINVLNFYLRKAIVAAQHDPAVAIAIADVQNLLAPPPSLLRPQIALRVWKNGRRSRAVDI